MKTISVERGRPSLGRTAADVWVVVKVRSLSEVGRRSAKPWMAGVVVPLAMTAAFLTRPWAAAALVPCAWWWSPRDYWKLGVVRALGIGMVGAMWATLGINGFQMFPAQRILVGWVWACWAGLLAQLAWMTRWWFIGRFEA